MFLAATFFLAIAPMCGCAAPRTAGKPAPAPPEKPVSVRLPVLTPMKIEPPSAPPGAEPAISNPVVEEGKAHSLRMFEVDYNRGKQGPPIEDNTAVPTDTEGKP
jgi:hypothetical protein